MKGEDIGKTKEGTKLICSACGKEIVKGKNNIHFMGKPRLIIEGIVDKGNEEELEPVCEECHNKMFGSD